MKLRELSSWFPRAPCGHCVIEDVTLGDPPFKGDVFNMSKNGISTKSHSITIKFHEIPWNQQSHHEIQWNHHQTHEIKMFHLWFLCAPAAQKHPTGRQTWWSRSCDHACVGIIPLRLETVFLWDFNGMFHGDLVGFHGDFVKFYGDLVGFHGYKHGWRFITTVKKKSYPYFRKPPYGYTVINTPRAQLRVINGFIIPISKAGYISWNKLV